jgi:hypothetical protein
MIEIGSYFFWKRNGIIITTELGLKITPGMCGSDCSVLLVDFSSF